jgi:hypothetical protein
MDEDRIIWPGTPEAEAAREEFIQQAFLVEERLREVPFPAGDPCGETVRANIRSILDARPWVGPPLSDA